MKNSILQSLLLFPVLSGCAAIVPMESKEVSDQVKRFETPHENMSGIVIYRSSSFFGSTVWENMSNSHTVWENMSKRSIWIDDKCIGDSAKDAFFYHEVEGNKEHKITTERDFGTNDLFLTTEIGKLYFIEQIMTTPSPISSSRLKLIDESEGKRKVSKLRLAKKGSCE